MSGASTALEYVSSSTSGASPGDRPRQRGQGRREHQQQPPRLPERRDGCPEHEQRADDDLHEQQQAGEAAELALAVGRHPRPHDPRAQERHALLAQGGAEHAVVLASLGEGRRRSPSSAAIHRSLVVQHGGRRLAAVARDEAPEPHRHRGEVGDAVRARFALVGRGVGRARRAGGHPVAATRHGVVVDERGAHVEAVAVGGALREHQLVEGASVVGAERHLVSFARAPPSCRAAQPSSSATARSTGTDPIVVRNTVSRATISAVSYRCAKTNTFCAVGSAASTVTA